MSKENQEQDYVTKKLIEELSKMPPMLIATAYFYAKNFELYGVDVTRVWATASINAKALSRAYEKGYNEGLKRQTESKNTL